MKIINKIIDFIKGLFKSNNDKQIKTMAKKKVNKEDQKTPEEIKQALINMLSPDEMKLPYKHASVVNHLEQPLILSSTEEFDKHYLNMGEMSIGFPTKMIPYIVNSLQEIYNKNKELKFKGDKTAEKEHDDLVADEISSIDYYDISSEQQSPEIKKAHESKARMKKIGEKLMKGDLSDLSDEDKAEIAQQLEVAASIASDTIDKLENGGLSREEMLELKKETNKQLQEHMKEVESVLLGKRAETEEDIDFEHIKKTFEKHGQAAAKEEIMRVDPTKRDEILAKMLDYMKSKQ